MLLEQYFSLIFNLNSPDWYIEIEQIVLYKLSSTTSTFTEIVNNIIKNTLLTKYFDIISMNKLYQTICIT